MSGGDYGGLKSILDEQKQLEKDQKSAPITECPLCGDLLVFNSKGVGNCPMGHYRSSRR